jgi:hypothetical protein
MCLFSMRCTARKFSSVYSSLTCLIILNIGGKNSQWVLQMNVGCVSLCFGFSFLHPRRRLLASVGTYKESKPFSGRVNKLMEKYSSTYIWNRNQRAQRYCFPFRPFLHCKSIISICTLPGKSSISALKWIESDSLIFFIWYEIPETVTVLNI